VEKGERILYDTKEYLGQSREALVARAERLTQLVDEVAEQFLVYDDPLLAGMPSGMGFGPEGASARGRFVSDSTAMFSKQTRRPEGRLREAPAPFPFETNHLAAFKHSQKSAASPVFDPSMKDCYSRQGLHPKYKKFYQDANDSKIFYSKDLGRQRAHAGEHWKMYRKSGEYLYHQADVDLQGNYIPKKKSPQGSIVDYNEINFY
jgi:hypothetical protein